MVLGKFIFLLGILFGINLYKWLDFDKGNFCIWVIFLIVSLVVIVLYVMICVIFF